MAPFLQPSDCWPIFNTCTPTKLQPRALSHTKQHIRYGDGWKSLLQSNQLSGTVPSSIGSLTSLLALYETQNRDILCFPSWRIDFVLWLCNSSELQGNQLNGTIPSAIGFLTDLQALYERRLTTVSQFPADSSILRNSILSGNLFTGTIPSTIGSLLNIQEMYDNCHRHPRSSFVNLIGRCDPLNRYLYSNQLSGTIPSTIGSLANLQQLYETHINMLSPRYSEQSRFLAREMMLTLPS